MNRKAILLWFWFSTSYTLIALVTSTTIRADSNIFLASEYGRIKSLRDPLKKMSKSDPDEKSRICLTDAPDVIVRNIKKAVTDFQSEVWLVLHIMQLNIIYIYCNIMKPFIVLPKWRYKHGRYVLSSESDHFVVFNNFFQHYS